MDTPIGRHIRWTLVVFYFVVIWVGITPGDGQSHGGKSHGGTNFSAFQAVQKAAQLYDRLITAGKLPESWETDLAAIEVATRQSAGKTEIVVQFRRTGGKPASVYFFFSQTGDYTGSNFSGQ